jgi:transposase
VTKLLHSWNFTAQKPAFRAYEQSPAAVRRWIEQQYPAIRQAAKRQCGLIFWLDETGMRSQHQAGTSFSPRGKTPLIKRSGQRFSLNMVSAISNRGHLVFMIVEGSFNGKVFIKFLSKLIKTIGVKVFVIVDGHPVHREKQVGKWLEAHRKQIALSFLPSYSPELNVDEYFNQDLKTNLVGKIRPHNKRQLKMMAQAFTRKTKRNPQKVKRYFHAKAVRYAIQVH